MFRKVLILFVFISFQAKAMDSLAPIVKDVMPSVVNISIETKQKEDEFDVENQLSFENDEPVFLGSGFVIGEEGYILTNKHVVEKAKKINVTTFNGDVYSGALKGVDDISDIALIKIEPMTTLKEVVLADSNLVESGDFVFAIGNPFGLMGSVTMGIVSAIGRDLRETEFDDYIQTDAMINPGNSGGPMFNIKGEVIGLNTSIFSKQFNNVGIGFAIPSNDLKPIYEALKNKGEIVRSSIGAKLKETLYNDEKALIVTVLEDEISDHQNELEVGDIIIDMNGQPIISKKKFEREISWLEPKSEVILGIIHKGELIKQPIKLKTLKNGKGNNTTKEKIKKNVQGLQYEELGLILDGVKILEVAQTSEAALKGIKAGDEILALNGQNFTKTNELKYYIQESLSENVPLHFDMKDGEGKLFFVDIMPKSE